VTVLAVTYVLSLSLFFFFFVNVLLTDLHYLPLSLLLSPLLGKQKFRRSDFRSGLSAIAESCVFAAFSPNTVLELRQ
jgi:hypothetical protein